MTQRWCIVYRTGGTERFQWHRSTVYTDKAACREAAGDNERSGYPSMVVDYDMSMSVGLPETFGWESVK